MADILVFEDNLMWSSRVKKSLSALGRSAVILTDIPAEIPEGEIAIVNLGSPKIQAESLVPLLKAKGVYVIAHAGHKETDLRTMGKAVGCDRIASNSELTFKLADLLSAASR